MPLIIEDGSIVTGANSYVTLADIKAYADARGITYPDDSALEINAILATDYLQSKCYSGVEVEPNVQPLAFPRDDLYIQGVLVANDSIPTQLKNAQIEAALAQNSQPLLQESGTDASVSDESLGPIKFTYDGGSSSSFNSQRVNLYLNSLLKPISLVRV